MHTAHSIQLLTTLRSHCNCLLLSNLFPLLSEPSVPLTFVEHPKRKSSSQAYPTTGRRSTDLDGETQIAPPPPTIQALHALQRVPQRASRR